MLDPNSQSLILSLLGLLHISGRFMELSSGVEVIYILRFPLSIIQEKNSNKSFPFLFHLHNFALYYIIHFTGFISGYIIIVQFPGSCLLFSVFAANNLLFDETV